MVAAHAEHAETRKQIQVAHALVIVEIGPLGADVVAVEANGPQHVDELRVEVPLVELELLAGPLLEKVADTRFHAVAFPRARTGEIASSRLHLRSPSTRAGADEADVLQRGWARDPLCCAIR